MHLICIHKNALGDNCPNKKTLISGNHKVLYKGRMWKARKLLSNTKYVQQVKYNKEILYNVLLDTHEVMTVNNLICETLHPENIIAKLHTYKDRDKLFYTVNEQILKQQAIVFERTKKRRVVL